VKNKANFLSNYLNNNEIRAFLFQAITIVAIFYFFYAAFDNMFDNIAARGISTGYGFLDDESGFNIAESLIEYSSASSNLTVFYVGILNTLLVSFVGIIFASVIGLLIGIARLSSNWLIAKLANGYIELFRNIPILLQIVFWYNILLINSPRSIKDSANVLDLIFINSRGFFMPKPIFEFEFFIVFLFFLAGLVGRFFIKKHYNKLRDETGKSTNTFFHSLLLVFGLPLIVFFLLGSPIQFSYPEIQGFNFAGGMNLSLEFIALALALSIYTATYIAEAVRAGIESVNIGQKEAAYSLGLTKTQSLKMVILPQALRVAIPPIINQYLNLTKNSSLATAIAYPDLVGTFAGTVLNQVGQAIEIIIMTMLVYLAISLFISFVLNVVNAKLSIKGR
jgi:general L-amino acid transport system permease protein